MEGYLLTVALPDLQRGMVPLGPPVPVQPPLLGWLLLATAPGLRREVAFPSRPGLRRGVAPLGRCP